MQLQSRSLKRPELFGRLDLSTVKFPAITGSSGGYEAVQNIHLPLIAYKPTCANSNRVKCQCHNKSKAFQNAMQNTFGEQGIGQANGFRLSLFMWKYWLFTKTVEPKKWMLFTIFSFQNSGNLVNGSITEYTFIWCCMGPLDDWVWQERNIEHCDWIVNNKCKRHLNASCDARCA